MHRFVYPRMQYVSYTTPVGEFKPVWFSKVKQMLKYFFEVFYFDWTYNCKMEAIKIFQRGVMFVEKC